MSTRVHSILDAGSSGIVITIESTLSNNLPSIVIVGHASKSVLEARERVRAAFAASKLSLPRKRITVNLAPADLPKSSSSFDLAIAASILQAAGMALRELSPKQAVIGELGLDGSIRPVRGIIGKLLAGRNHSINSFIIPAANLLQAKLVPHVQLLPISHLKQLSDYLQWPDQPSLTPINTQDGLFRIKGELNTNIAVQLSDITGQHHAKRALQIAAAGGHNLLFTGPPGTGKSMLAKALAGLLPPLMREEMLEVTQLHSLASNNFETIQTFRPFRAPHHSASQTAIIGGGVSGRPGEVSLSHRGVLFLDELPEFARTSLEALRQPLEDRVVTLTRSHGSTTYPADCMLVATANLCPCGFYGSTKPCNCTAAAIAQYQRKLSGPLLDRIDLYSFVEEVTYDGLLSTTPSSQSDVQGQIAAARQLQYRRTSQLNASLTNAELKQHVQASPAAIKLLQTAAERLKLSPRGYFRALKVGRTIADLADSPTLELEHISEALQYRRS